MAKPSLIEHSPRTSRDKRETTKETVSELTAMAASMHFSRVRFGDQNEEKRRAYLRLRSCLFCEGRISVLKRWFKTPIQNAVHGSTVYASLEKKTISWACTAHCSRLLFELKWTGKAFIWRHLNVVICDFAFMLPPESAFCSNHDRKRTFLGVLNRRFETRRRLFENKHGRNSVLL